MLVNKNENSILMHFLRGINTIIVDYKNDTEVTVKIGSVHLNNGVKSDVFDVLTEFDFDAGSLSASTWYYVMVDVPEEGMEITSDDVSVTDTEPSLDEEKLGYYSGDGLSRCIGVFLTDGDSDIKAYMIRGVEWRTKGPATAMVAGQTASGWNSFTWDIPFDDLVVFGAFQVDYVNMWNLYSYSLNGSNRHLQGLFATVNSDQNSIDCYLPTNGKTGYSGWSSGGNSNTGTIRRTGFIMFPYLYKHP